MKRAKTGPKSEVKMVAKKAPIEARSNSDDQLPSGPIVEPPKGGLIILPDPGALLDEASQEPDHTNLSEYWKVIAKLREKGLTFREIAQWLGERKIEADHNAVYRVYTNYMTCEQARIEADLEEREKQIEGL